MKSPAKLFSVMVLVLLSAIMVVPVSAEATVTEVYQSCSLFSARGTTDQPYIVIEVWSWIDQPNTWVDHSFIVVPSNGDGTFDVVVPFAPQAPGTMIYYWLWGSAINSTSGWDGQAWYDSGAVACTNPTDAPAPPLPKGFVLHTITCDVAVYETPAGSPVQGATIRAGQTWYVNPTPVDGSDGQGWTEIFAAGWTNGFIPTACVGGAA